MGSDTESRCAAGSGSRVWATASAAHIQVISRDLKDRAPNRQIDL